MRATVAWLDIGSRVGLCPIHVLSVQARNPLAFDLVPVPVAGALGKACAECGSPLAGDAREGARVLVEEWVVA